ncbi:Protein of unknown function [Polaromonas sp. OV174]|uniref:DUF3108 domain-containing protein n=1 Tax=Polaromonas sp. OV174 TaxID=1855300 RepID=UPI0008F438D5|nr:DUF3108 domain-containing protein [Polaromonas sp. OV174]SFC07201.1 Protein of unknown function [Polaromonas sp. OV174]
MTAASGAPAPLLSERPALPWRKLAALAVLVLLVHLLLLQTASEHWGPEASPVSPRAPALLTRRIEPVAVPPVAAQAPVAPVKKPVFKKKVAIAQAQSAPPATNSIAEPAPEPAVTDAATGTAEVDGEPQPPTAIPTPAMEENPAPPAPQEKPVTAMALPGSALLAYTMTGSAKGLNYHAKAELDWQNQGASYAARMGVSALFLGSRSMASSGQIGADGLAPMRFSDKSRSEVAAHFDADKGQISFSANTPNVPWVKGVQDRVSVLLQLGGMLAGNPAGFPVGTNITVYTVGPRDADSWTFLVEGEESLKLPYGELNTLKLARQPRREFDQKVEVWYAPALGYLPVRSKITQANGDFIDQQLSDVNKP